MTTAERVLYLLVSDYGWHTIRDLAIEAGVSRREVEQAVQQLRLADNPIATGQRGVRLAHTADELAESYRSLHHRLREQYRTLRAQRRAEAALRTREAGDLTFWGTP